MNEQELREQCKREAEAKYPPHLAPDEIIGDHFMLGKTCKAYEVIRFRMPDTDRDTSVLVNRQVLLVREWAGHMGEVRVVSLSESKTRDTHPMGLLTIEYTQHDTSGDEG